MPSRHRLCSYRGSFIPPDGQALESRNETEAINPASVVKVATSLWALEQLGPDHRFETTIGVEEGAQLRDGTLEGALIVDGGKDPDFHTENVFLVAQGLHELGVRRIKGPLICRRRVLGGLGARLGRAPS